MDKVQRTIYSYNNINVCKDFRVYAFLFSIIYILNKFGCVYRLL